MIHIQALKAKMGYKRAAADDDHDSAPASESGGFKMDKRQAMAASFAYFLYQVSC